MNSRLEHTVAPALEIPSVATIRRTLMHVPEALRDDEPTPEYVADDNDPALEVWNPERVEGSLAPVEHSGEALDASPVTDEPLVTFEVPPQVTDADLRYALGDERIRELQRLEQIRGIDALGWYVTFHQRSYQHGVHIPLDGVIHLARQAFSQLELPVERKLELAFHAIARHELFHFAADCMTANWELATGVAVRWPGQAKYRNTDGYDEYEEGLANAYMLRGFKHPSRVLANSGGAYSALKGYCRRQPAGYRDGPDYARSRSAYLENCGRLSHDYHGASEAPWHAPGALDPLIFYPNIVRIDWTRCPIIIHDSGKLLEQLGIGISSFRAIASIVETAGFTKSLCKLDRRLQRQWQMRKDDLARSTDLRSLDFKRWKPGGKDCYSVRVDGNYRAHLRYNSSEFTWAAEQIGDHKRMGHG
ncbi:hypothetical protein [Gordonia sp. NPDC003585]|uniref:hypothetical protein n=1 Tax=Gordonia sp. NPDC003585 TaxID=3154275 RepID=UPI00339ED42C